MSLDAFGAGPNSVAVGNGVVAVAVEADPKTDPGTVVFLNPAGKVRGSVEVGALPDMLTFTPTVARSSLPTRVSPAATSRGTSIRPAP